MDAMRIYGAAQKPAAATGLKAGPLQLIYADGEIRYLRIAGKEVLRRVYVAVRDRQWSTIPGRISDLQLERGEESFCIRFTMTHQGRGVHFIWQGRIEGTPQGHVRFEMDGVAADGFETNRTGICVLHPSCLAGEACKIEHTDGSATQSHFPIEIAPHQPFKNVAAIEHAANGAHIRIAMEGEKFETEDQRNYSDGSFKTYSRPLALGRYKLEKGRQVRQAVTIDVQGHVGEGQIRPAAALDLMKAAHGEWTPQIGLDVAEGFDRLDGATLSAIKSMHLRFLRLQVDPFAEGWQQRLKSLAGNLREIGLPLAVVIYMPASGGEKQLQQLAQFWPSLQLKVQSWQVLSSAGVTSAQNLEIARSALAPLDETALFGGGSDGDFVAINQTHPPFGQLDMVCFGVNPQVHAVDHLSLMENLQSHGDLVSSAAHYFGDIPIAVAPIALSRPRRSIAPASGELPEGVDPRQMSLFAAAWTVGSLTRLCHADFLSYFQTHGWRGVLQGPEAPPLPQLFPARPGELFPVYHVIKSLQTFSPEYWTAPAVANPLELAAMLLIKPGRQRLLLANLTAAPQRVDLILPEEAAVTLLDASSVEQAAADAEFWINAEASSLSSECSIDLGDYAIAQVDWSLT